MLHGGTLPQARNHTCLQAETALDALSHPKPYLLRDPQHRSHCCTCQPFDSHPGLATYQRYRLRSLSAALPSQSIALFCISRSHEPRTPTHSLPLDLADKFRHSRIERKAFQHCLAFSDAAVHSSRGGVHESVVLFEGCDQLLIDWHINEIVIYPINSSIEHIHGVLETCCMHHGLEIEIERRTCLPAWSNEALGMWLVRGKF